MSARLKEVQRKAEPDVKAKALKIKAALAETKLELDLDAEKLELEEQMVINAVRCKVLDNLFIRAHHPATPNLTNISNTEDIMMSIVTHLRKPLSLSFRSGSLAILMTFFIC